MRQNVRPASPAIRILILAAVLAAGIAAGDLAVYGDGAAVVNLEPVNGHIESPIGLVQ